MIIKIIDSAFGKVGDLCFKISQIITVFLVISITWEVANRFLFSSSSVWVSEVSGYLVSSILFLAAGRVYREGGHVSMSIFVDMLSGSPKLVFMALVDLLVLILALVVGYATYDMALLSYQLNWQSSTTLGMPLYIPQMLMPIGSVVLAFEALRQCLRNISRVVNTGQGEAA
ncbi:TRAP transporter small permease subunit [Marinobacterium iners]|uniref:TRAP transporter small permease protein n=1 Tax=Marinobacterium iners DSM 11526 TaxID=1122198 RepID=A0A1H3XVP7_9GAMM|nr:TRAP transporter small permease [Marinobacterium iners]SEA02588.1 TRAP-type mannitol/chloroaromatic compound transport system, small permease component [Marinobacterium iners DSM 11526]